MSRQQQAGGLTSASRDSTTTTTTTTVAQDDATRSPVRPPLRKKPRPSDDSGYGTRDSIITLAADDDAEMEIAESDHGEGHGELLENVIAAAATAKSGVFGAIKAPIGNGALASPKAQGGGGGSNAAGSDVSRALPFLVDAPTAPRKSLDSVP